MAGYKYPNPPIEEATCQFTLSEPLVWGKSTASLLFEHFRDTYPGMPAQQQLLQANLTPGEGVDTPNLALAQNERIVFIDSSGANRLSVGPTTIGVHRGRPYVGYVEELRPRLLQDVPKLLNLLEHSQDFVNVSTRYVNKIEIDGKKFELGEYFNYWGESTALPQPFDGNIAGFFYRTAGRHREMPVMLTLTFGSIESPKDTSSFVLDIDVTRHFDEKVQLKEAVAYLNDLKALENEIFESLITDKCRELFQ